MKTAPSGDLAAAIDRDFGSLDDLKKKLKETAVNHFASGWAWLVSRDGTLSVTDTHDAGTELVAGIKPLLVIDVWEHAYYIDRKNVRPDYRSEEHTSELQSLMRISYAVFCLKNKTTQNPTI